MTYDWNWAILLQPVATGEGTTYLGWLIDGFIVTTELTLAGWVVALGLGTLFGVMRTLPGRIPRIIGTAYVTIFRNIPLIVQFFIWYYVVPQLLPSALGDSIKHIRPLLQFFLFSVLALGVYTGARLCEQVRAGIQALRRDQINAGLAMGLSLAQTYRYIVLPQVFRRILGPLTSEFLIISKNSAIASTIGLMGLSAQAVRLVEYTAHSYEPFILVTLAYFLLNGLMLLLMRAIRRYTARPGLMGE